MLGIGTAPREGQRSVMGTGTTTRVVLADDHAVVRQGLKRMLNRASEIEVVGEASDGAEALSTVKELKPDVLLLDIEMPVMDGIEVARRLQEEWNGQVRILILSAYDDREYIRALLDIGVSGYLVKGEAPGKIVEAVRGVAQGQKGWVSPQVRKKLEKMQDRALKHGPLSSRDLEMLHLMAEGRTDRYISDRLNMSAEECQAVMQALMHKVGAASRKEAVETAVREGWTTAKGM